MFIIDSITIAIITIILLVLMIFKPGSYIILILLFYVSIYGIIRYFIKKSKIENNNDIAWPPVTNPCPDYFVDMGNDGSVQTCKNVHNLGLCTGTGSDPKIYKFNIKQLQNDKQSICRNYCTPITCNLSWEGVDDKCA